MVRAYADQIQLAKATEKSVYSQCYVKNRHRIVMIPRAYRCSPYRFLAFTRISATIRDDKDGA